MKRIFHKVQQNGDEWHKLRLGKITSSNFGTIMANNGQIFGAPAKRYAMRIAIELITGEKVETYKNDYMTMGHELEPLARKRYTEITRNEVFAGGFMEYGPYGDSIDGLLGDARTGIEIKSVLYNTHFERLLKGGYDTAYKWQICGHIWIHDLESCDFVSYSPGFPEDKDIYIFNVERNDEMIYQLERRLGEFTVLVDEYKRALE